jgi:hypothetical protein
MRLAQAKGYLDSASWYDMLISQEKEKQKSLKAERKKLLAQLENITYGTDEWWDAQEAIEAVDEAIADSDVTLQEYVNTQRQVEFDNFDYTMGQVERLTKESQFIMDMMQNKEMTNDEGGLSDYGIASLGLHTQNLDIYKKQAEAYGKEIQRIKDMLKETPNDTNLIAQLQEYEDAQRDCLIATEQTKKSIVDLVKDGYQKLVDSLSKVADKYKEVLRNAKDANDYQNTIAEKTEEADNLRKKLIAYESMSGNEDIASKIQKTQKELKEAEKDIQETMYERYISDTENALDELLYELETYINEMDFKQIFKNAMNTVNGNTGDIATTLSGIATNSGTTISDALKSIWTNGYTPEKGFNSVVAAIEKLERASDKQANKTEKEVEKETDTQKYQKAYEKAKSSYKNTSNLKGNDLKKAKAENKKTAEEFLKSIVKSDIKPDNPSELDKKIHSITGGYLDNYGKEWVAKTFGIKNDDKVMLQVLKSIGFATGGIATVDSGTLRKTGEDGWILARNGEGFVSPENVQDIKELMRVVPNMTKLAEMSLVNPIQYNLHTLPKLDVVPVRNMQQPTQIQDVNISFELPNATNANDVAKELMNNNKLWKSMATRFNDEIIGKSGSLAYRRHL